MCFGNNQTSTSTQDSTQAPPAWLSNAANENVNFAQGVQSKGFTPYSGQQVADFAPQQQSSFNLGDQITGGVSPYVGDAGGMVENYATAGPQSVNAESISSQMTPYMNQYVSQALAPQIESQNQQFADQNKSFDSAATGAGAFGDSSYNLGRGNLTQQQDTARSGLVGQAYTNAFNTAIGAGAQDVSNNLNAQDTNANLAETALGRQLTGATTLNTMGTGADQLENTLGLLLRGLLADLNAAYNQWQMGQQYPFQTTQLMDQAITAGRAGAPITTNGTTTTQTPDNSGFGILGSLGGSLLSSPGAGAAAAGMLAFLADGGFMEPGQPTIVGERGPELMIPNSTGVVIPHEVLQAATALRDGAPNPATNPQGFASSPAYMGAGSTGYPTPPVTAPTFASGATSLASGNAGPWQNPDGGAAPAPQSAAPTASNDNQWSGLAKALGSIGSKMQQPAAPKPPQQQPQQPAQMPVAPMQAVSLPGGGTSMVPTSAPTQNLSTKAGTQPLYQFGIAA